jgi:glycosyltransferase involved in cell wall biosynthesis
MKVCLIGSRGIFTYKFAKYYTEKKGFEVVVIAGPNVSYDKPFDFVKLYRAKSTRVLCRIWYILKVLRKEKPDVVHYLFVNKTAIAPLLMFRRPFRYVCSVFGSDIYRGLKKRTDRIFKRLALRYCDAIVYNSHQMGKEIIRFMPGIDRNKLNPILMGVDFDLFDRINDDNRQVLKSACAVTDRDVMILSFRGLSAVYNQKVIIDSIPELVSRYSGLKFVFVAGSSRAEDVAATVAHVKARGVEDHVVLIERFLSQELLASLIQMARLVVNIPSTDQFAVSILETMAAGTPLILSPLETYRDYLKDGENCFYMKEISPAALVEKVNDVMRLDDSAVENIIRNNRAVVKENYNFARQMEKICSVYTS